MDNVETFVAGLVAGMVIGYVACMIAFAIWGKECDCNCSENNDQVRDNVTIGGIQK